MGMGGKDRELEVWSGRIGFKTNLSIEEVVGMLISAGGGYLRSHGLWHSVDQKSQRLGVGDVYAENPGITPAKANGSCDCLWRKNKELVKY